MSGPVPEPYQTAVSIGGETRNPDELQTKADVQFSEYDEALENAAINPDDAVQTARSSSPTRTATSLVPVRRSRATTRLRTGARPGN